MYTDDKKVIREKAREDKPAVNENDELILQDERIDQNTEPVEENSDNIYKKPGEQEDNRTEEDR